MINVPISLQPIIAQCVHASFGSYVNPVVGLAHFCQPKSFYRAVVRSTAQPFLFWVPFFMLAFLRTGGGRSISECSFLKQCLPARHFHRQLLCALFSNTTFTRTVLSSSSNPSKAWVFAVWFCYSPIKKQPIAQGKHYCIRDFKKNK